MLLVDDKLANTECPFLWRVDSASGDTVNIKDKMLSCLDETDENQDVFYNFIYYITALYDIVVFKKDIETAKIVFEKYQWAYHTLKNDDRMRKYESASLHVFTSIKAYLFFDESNIDYSSNLISQIPPLNNFNELNKAGIYGIKAAFMLEFGPFEPTEDGCRLANEAIKLDSSEGEWYYLYGKGLHRKRRCSRLHALPKREEMKNLEIAVELSRNASKMVFLAECYVDAVNALYSQNKCPPRDDKKTIFEKMGNAAIQLYKEAAVINKAWYIRLRCGMGFMKISPPFRDYDMANRYLMEAEQLKSDNGFLYHQLSIVNSRMQEKEKAYKYAKKASDLGIVIAVVDEIRHGVSLWPKFDVIAGLDRNFEKFSANGQSMLLAQKASYYMFKLRRLDDALATYLEAFRLCVKIPISFESHNPCIDYRWSRKFFSLPEFLVHLLVSMKKRGIETTVETDELEKMIKEKCSVKLTEEKPIITELIMLALGQEEAVDLNDKFKMKCSLMGQS